ncbi:hypothetical protein [Enterococcus nangangensis]|nr:hypothetical protein [Enterococcus nangangensis]
MPMTESPGSGKGSKMLESIWQILIIIKLMIEIAHELKKDPKE